MKLNVDLPQLDEVLTELEEIKQTLKEISMTGDEAVQAIKDVTSELQKAQTEISGKIQALTDALANTVLPPAAEQALADLKASAQALDDIVPDAT
jgi:uncharacterized coiled-coil DUF342 family protein